VTISNPNMLFIIGTGVNPGIRSWKKHLSGWARCQKAIGGICLTKKWRAETLQPGSEFDEFKPRLKSSIFKCISWLNGLFLGSDDWSFLEDGVNTYLMAQMSPLSSPTFTKVGNWEKNCRFKSDTKWVKGKTDRASSYP
jgi:hypothetical protein